MDDRQKLLRCVSAAEFAALETRLFLDTHPDCEEALCALAQYSERADALRRQYENAYGPLTNASADLDNRCWVKDPWPWDYVR